MRSSQVYQPTTTSLPYGRSKMWMPSFFAKSDSTLACSRIMITVLAGSFALMGMVMIIVGALYFQILGQDGTYIGTSSVYVTVLCVGIIFEVVVIAGIIFYYRHIGYYVPCCPGKIARIRKHLNESRIVGGKGQCGQPVSAQYCPPAPASVGNSPPPPFTDISEQQKLMSEKQEQSDDNERIEDDPRIVLTPLKNHEEC